MLDEDDDQQIVETFARFGRAIYMANVVEVGLAQTLMQIEFLTPAREKFIAEKGKDFDQAAFDADFTAFMAKQFSKTMGQLKQRVAEVSNFDEALRKRIIDATERRNFLAHHYWRESAEQFMTEDGRAKMIEELTKDAEVFEQLDKDIRSATKPVRERLGIKEALLNEGVEEQLGQLLTKLKQ